MFNLILFDDMKYMNLVKLPENIKIIQPSIEELIQKYENNDLEEYATTGNFLIFDGTMTFGNHKIEDLINKLVSIDVNVLKRCHVLVADNLVKEHDSNFGFRPYKDIIDYLESNRINMVIYKYNSRQNDKISNILKILKNGIKNELYLGNINKDFVKELLVIIKGLINNIITRDKFNEEYTNIKGFFTENISEDDKSLINDIDNLLKRSDKELLHGLKQYYSILEMYDYSNDSSIRR